MFQFFLQSIFCKFISYPENLIPEPKIIPSDSAKALLRQYADMMVNDPDKFFSGLMKDFIHFGIKIIIALLIYIIGAILIKWLKRFLHGIFERRKTEPTMASFILSMVSISLSIFLIIIIVGILGVNTTSIAALLAAGGMAIGMALSGTLQNFAGGIMILSFKPFRAGDHIQSQGFEGVVKEVNIVSTKIRTFDNAIIIMPNGTLFNSNITNVTHSYFRRVKWNVGVEYGSDAEKVKALIMKFMQEEPKILHPDGTNDIVADPAVNLKELQDSAICFYARAWTTVQDYWDVYFSILERIYKELPENGINFPFPQMDVHLFQENKINKVNKEDVSI